MRSAVTMAGLALFVAACGTTTGDNGAGTTAGSTTGEATNGSGTTGGDTTGASTTGGRGGTTGVMDAGLPDGTDCTDNLACASHVCGMTGSGKCCSIACTSTNAACAASECDDNGTCVYPSSDADGGALPACGGTCSKGLLDGFFCDTSGNCSVSTGQSFPCPNSFGCNAAGNACLTSCSSDNDCFAGAFCHNSACAPRVVHGACFENDGCVSQVCDIAGNGDCCNAQCPATADPACNATNCDATSGACVYPAAKACGADTCVNSMFTIAAQGACNAAGTCITAPAQCPNFFGCNAGGTACNTTCTLRTDCASGYYCNGGACIPEIPLGACFENDECTSDFCGTNLTTAGQGGCCVAQCGPTKDPACDPINCDTKAGACVYPAGFACGNATCTGNAVTNACDATGACQPNTAACGGHLTCNKAGTDCNHTCAADTDCVSGYWCNGGTCQAQIAVGACTGNDNCLSNICGVSGTGDCCTAACPDTDATCAYTGCDAKTGACTYPTSTTACGKILANCTNGIESNPSACDGMGNCPTPGTTVCAPYVCDSSTSTCFTTCSDATSCTAGDFCDNGKCCALGNGATITVDSKKGKDTAACCGMGTNTPCLTLTHAMALIDEAQASGVTIKASINGAGNGGTWAPKGESYPITLGWGVELNAPGVYFYDPNGGNGEIFDINFYSANDTVGYASIVGSSSNQVHIGWDQNGDQTTDAAAIQIENGNTLYIANAEADSSQNLYYNTGNDSNAITVAAGGSLMLGQDQSGGNTGTVNVGSTNNYYNWNGIVCQTDSVSLGCTITDANLNGTSSVVILFQTNLDIDAEDFANISLTSNPVIGPTQGGPGFQECSSWYGKPECQSSNNWPNGQAVLLNGDVNMTFNNGTVQCITGYGFLMQATSEGSPTLNMDSTTIQNTEYGIYATAGTATITNSTIQYNYNGVQQGTDGTNIATIDLSGGGNTVVCSSDAESVSASSVGVSVFDSTTSNLNASNVSWDTSGPDQFSCTDNTFGNCNCPSGNCTVGAGSDGMDAVYDSAGTIDTSNNGTATQACTPPCGSNPACPADDPNDSCCLYGNCYPQDYDQYYTCGAQTFD